MKQHNFSWRQVELLKIVMIVTKKVASLKTTPKQNLTVTVSAGRSVH